MYVIHTDLHDLPRTLRPNTPLYVEAFTREEYNYGLAVRLTSEVLISGLGADDAAHVTRLVVECADLLCANPRSVRAAVCARAEHARQVVVAAATRSGRSVVRGLVSALGLRDDLGHYEARHDLWHWEASLHGERQLVDLETSL
jgi:hypothetical protein